METSVQPTLIQVRVGPVKPLGPRGVPSGFVKGPVPGNVSVHSLGLSGDAQADLVNHGGVDKAVYAYSSHHYAAWRSDYPHIAEIGELGAMGENLCIAGQTEETVCVGDICGIGTCLLQVTQPRKPCFKLAARFNEGSLPSRLVETGRSGWYFRVLEEGTIAPGEPVQLVQRLHADWPVARVARVTYSADSSEDELKELLDVDALAPAWRLHVEAAMSARMALRLKGQYRRFRVRATIQQSETIKSFVFEPSDGNGVMPHRPGQYLTLRFTPEGRTSPLIRTYSLAATSNGRNYAISVKREGVGSGWLHDHATVGSEIEIGSPKGQFALDQKSARPLVLISAGVGIVPLLGMLRATVVNDGVSNGTVRQVVFIHGARSSREHAHAEDVRVIASNHAAVQLHVAYSQPAADDEQGKHFHSVGRIEKALLAKLLPTDESDVYVCGPTGFMRDIVQSLTDLGTPAERIATETFGPSSLHGAQAADPGKAPASTVPVRVRFSASDKEAIWEPTDETLLELAERSGVEASSECRTGNCGTCAVPLKKGGVSYRFDPSVAIPDGQILLCCSQPAAPEATEMLVLDV